MNIYTVSSNDLATIANVGPSSAKKIVQLRDEVLAGKHAPITIQDLASIRLSVENWQSLIDNGTISIDLPPVKGAEKVDPSQPKYMTHAEMMDAIRLVVQEQSVVIGKHISSLRTEVTGQMSDLHSQMTDQVSDLETKMTNRIADMQSSFTQGMSDVERRLATEIHGNSRQCTFLSAKVDEVQARFDDVQRIVSHQASQVLPGFQPVTMPDYTSREMAERKGTEVPVTSAQEMPGALPQRAPGISPAGVTGISQQPIKEEGAPSRQLTFEQALIEKLMSPIPTDGIYVSKDGVKPTTSRSAVATAKIIKPQAPPPDGQYIKPLEEPPKDKTKDRGRSKVKGLHSERRSSDSESSDGESDRSVSPLPPKMEVFSGDPKGLTWSSFISKFDRIAKRRNWTKRKRLDRLFDCLSEKALEYANRSEGRNSYRKLKKELGLRFDLKEAPVAARQKLHLMKQNDDEGLEEYLQRVLTSAMDGFNTADNNTVQQLATEAFLRGCKHKEASAYVFNESPRTIQEACQKVKTVLANRKAIFGSKVSFQERAFTLEEERRVSEMEKQIQTLTSALRRSSPSPFREQIYGDSRRYPSSSYPYGPWDLEQRPQSPSYGRSWSPRDYRADGYENGYRRGRSPTIRQRDRPQQRSPLPTPREADKLLYNQSPVRGNARGRSPYYERNRPEPRGYRNRNISPGYGARSSPERRPYNYPPRGPSPTRYQDREPFPSKSDQKPPDTSPNIQQPKIRSVDSSHEQLPNQDLNLEGLVVPATDF